MNAKTPPKLGKIVTALFGPIAGFRLSYLPPLMVYAAAGISTLTGIVMTVFRKEYVGLTDTEFVLLMFWAGLPWASKMFLGHLVDLAGKWKSIFVYLGAGVITCSLAIFLGLTVAPDMLAAYFSIKIWFVIATLLAPLGYVMQDVVADAMTVEAVPHIDDNGNPIDEETQKHGHVTMQTLGRVAIVIGGVLVAAVNLAMFSGLERTDEVAKLAAYSRIFAIAFAIPVVSILGVALASVLKAVRKRRLLQSGKSPQEVNTILNPVTERTRPDWRIIIGSCGFIGFAIGIGGLGLLGKLASYQNAAIEAGSSMAEVTYGGSLQSLVGYVNSSPILQWIAEFNAEIIFLGSATIILYLMSGLFKNMDKDGKAIFIGTALILFAYRCVPLAGPGVEWWQMDVLGFDELFFSVLSLTASFIALFVMFIYHRWFSKKTILYLYGILTVLGTALYLPDIVMFYGFHEWTESVTGGWVTAKTIALVDVAAESPLVQVAMIPSLAWTARFAPPHLKATFFAVVASFMNLALSASSLGTKYLTQIFPISREVTDPVSGAVTGAADFGMLGWLLIAVAVLGFVIPMAAIYMVKKSDKMKSW